MDHRAESKLGYARVSTEDPNKPAVYWPMTPVSWIRVERGWAAWLLQIMREKRPKGSHSVRWWRSWRNAGGVDDTIFRTRREEKQARWHLHLEVAGDLPMERTR